MYDFANSAYTTVVITAVFNAYFVAVVAAGRAGDVRVDAGVVCQLCDRHLQRSDRRCVCRRRTPSKKKLLGITTSGCVLGTANFPVLVGPGDLALAFALIVLWTFFSARR